MKENAHTIQTKKNIQYAFLELLREYTFSDITVMMVCDKANIHKTTFYRHYATTFVWKQETERAVLEHLDKLQRSAADREQIREMVLHFLYSVNEHREVISIVTSKNFESNLFSQLYHRVLKKAEEDYDIRHIPMDRDVYMRKMIFVISGAMGVIEAWFKNDCEESPEAILGYLVRGLELIIPELIV